MKLSRTAVVVIATVAATLTAGAFAIGAIPGADGTIRACVAQPLKGPGGDVRFIDAEQGQTCGSGEKTVTLNQTGPRGATGATGPQGATGATGPAGSDAAVAAKMVSAGQSVPAGIYSFIGTTTVSSGSTVAGSCAPTIVPGFAGSTIGWAGTVPAGQTVAVEVMGVISAGSAITFSITCNAGVTVAPSQSFLLTKLGATNF